MPATMPEAPDHPPLVAPRLAAWRSTWTSRLACCANWLHTKLPCCLRGAPHPCRVCLTMPCQRPCRFYTTQGAGVRLLTLRIGDRIWDAPGAPPLATQRSADRQQVASADGTVALLLDTTARNHWVAAHSIGLAAFLIAELLLLRLLLGRVLRTQLAQPMGKVLEALGREAAEVVQVVQMGQVSAEPALAADDVNTCKVSTAGLEGCGDSALSSSRGGLAAP